MAPDQQANPAAARTMREKTMMDALVAIQQRTALYRKDIEGELNTAIQQLHMIDRQEAQAAKAQAVEKDMEKKKSKRPAEKKADE